MKVDAVILAGAPNDGQLKNVDQSKWEASIPIQGKPMVTYVIEALQQSALIAEIVVVGPLELQEIIPSQVTFVEAADSLPDNVFRALDVLKKKNNILLVTSDIPFVHSEAIDDFIVRCGELDGDVYYPLISKEANQQHFPEAVRTYFTLKEGVFTGGNILLASPESIINSRWAMD